MGLIAVGSGPLFRKISETQALRDANDDLNRLESEVFAYVANEPTCTRIFNTFEFNTANPDPNLAVTANPATEGFVEVNPTLAPGSTSYSPRFDIDSIALFRDPGAGVNITGRIVITVTKKSNIIGAGTVTRGAEIPVAIRLVAAGNPADILTCRAARYNDEAVCNKMDGNWITPGASATGVGFCDLCSTVGATRPLPPNPADACVFPTGPTPSPPPYLWKVCGPGGSGGPDCTAHQGQPCSPGFMMGCTFKSFYSGYLNTPAILGCGTCGSVFPTAAPPSGACATGTYASGAYTRSQCGSPGDTGSTTPTVSGCTINIGNCSSATPTTLGQYCTQTTFTNPNMCLVGGNPASATTGYWACCGGSAMSPGPSPTISPTPAPTSTPPPTSAGCAGTVWTGTLNCTIGAPTYTDCAADEMATISTTMTTRTCPSGYNFSGYIGSCSKSVTCGAVVLCYQRDTGIGPIGGCDQRADTWPASNGGCGPGSGSPCPSSACKTIYSGSPNASLCN